MAKDTATPAIRYQKERGLFHQLLRANPNYFGNLKTSVFKPVLKLAADTTYEQLGCVAFNPLQNLLEAHVHIKQPTGYGSDLCGAGSSEYVRFYVDYGSGWQDAGVVAFSAHNLPNGVDCAKVPDKPLVYVASLPYNPKRETCKTAVLPRVRAILSWNLEPPPNQPNWPPIWGHVLDQHVQSPARPRRLIDLVDIFAEQVGKPVELPEELVPVKELPIPIPDPEPLEISALVDLYARRKKTAKGSAAALAVEPQRFATSDLTLASAGGVLNQNNIALKAAFYKELGLDYAQVVAALNQTQADVSYEEVRCLGLDQNRSLLTATFVIKRSAGYSGPLCSYGSYEHVAFWIDWDNSCDWTYLGTTSIKVHDIDPLPADGLAYAATWKVNLSEQRRSCKKPKIARVRAVLSWSTLPSTTDPNALTAWGNRLDTHVLVAPAGVVAIGPGLAIIGGVGVADINVAGNGLTKPNAKFALYGTPADPFVPTRECPFGGLVTLQGAPPVGPSPIVKYRAWAQNVTLGLEPMKLTRKIWVVDNNGVGSFHLPDADGFFAYLSDAQNIEDLLAYWDSAGDDQWVVWLEFADATNSSLGTSALHSIQLDNTGPSAEVHINSGGDCKDFVQGVVVAGQFTATDSHFGHYEMHAVPLSMSPNAVTPSSGVSAVVAGAWSLDTTGMAPCGYVVELRVYDRSIVGSHPSSWNGGYDDVGLCLRSSNTD